MFQPDGFCHLALFLPLTRAARRRGISPSNATKSWLYHTIAPGSFIVSSPCAPHDAIDLPSVPDAPAQKWSMKTQCLGQA